MQSHSNYASDLFDTGLFSDCTIYCRNKVWHLHRSTLAQRCSFFRACFASHFRESLPNTETGMIEVSMHEDEPEALKRLLKWLYTLQYPRLPGTLDHEQTFGVSHNEGDCNDKPERAAKPLKAVHKVSHGTTSQDEGYISDGSLSDINRHSCSAPTLPETFWTSELHLLTIAEKYGLDDLASQASESICQTIKTSMSSLTVDTTNAGDDALLDDFVIMLQDIYADFPTPSIFKPIQETIMNTLAVKMAVCLDQQTRFQDLVETCPAFAVDLIGTLRCQLETNADKIAQTERKSEHSQNIHGYPTTPDSPSQTPGGRPQKIYIPMNEDSDED